MKKISRVSLSFLFFFSIVLLGLNSCASKDKPSPSGFLSDYSKLGPSPYKDADNVLVYFNPDLLLKNYNKFIVNPVQIRLAPEGLERGIKREQLGELAEYFYDELIKELEKSDYEIAHDPGPGTLLLRIAITDVKPAKRALNIHPGTIISGMGLGGASAEVEIIDTLTGEIVVAAVDTRKGKRGFSGLTKYGNAKNVIEVWAKRLIIRMDEAHGKTRPEKYQPKLND